MSCETAASHVPARTPGERVIPADPHVQRDGSGGGRDDEPPGQDAGDDQHRLDGRDADGDLHPSAAQPARELALAMLDDETAHAPTVDTAGPVASRLPDRRDDPCRPLRTQRLGRCLGPLAGRRRGRRRRGPRRSRRRGMRRPRAAARTTGTRRDRSAGARARSCGRRTAASAASSASRRSAKPSAPSRASKAR